MAWPFPWPFPFLFPFPLPTPFETPLAWPLPLSAGRRAPLLTTRALGKRRMRLAAKVCLCVATITVVPLAGRKLMGVGAAPVSELDGFQRLERALLDRPVRQLWIANLEREHDVLER